MDQDVTWREEAAALRDSIEVKEEQISVLRASVSDAVVLVEVARGEYRGLDWSGSRGGWEGDCLR